MKRTLLVVMMACVCAFACACARTQTQTQTQAVAPSPRRYVVESVPHVDDLLAGCREPLGMSIDCDSWHITGPAEPPPFPFKRGGSEDVIVDAPGRSLPMIRTLEHRRTGPPRVAFTMRADGRSLVCVTEQGDQQERACLAALIALIATVPSTRGPLDVVTAPQDDDG